MSEEMWKFITILDKNGIPKTNSYNDKYTKVTEFGLTIGIVAGNHIDYNFYPWQRVLNINWVEEITNE